MKAQLLVLLSEMETIAAEMQSAEEVADSVALSELRARFDAKSTQYEELYSYAAAERKAGLISSIERWQYMRAIDGFLPIELAWEWASRELGRNLESLSECTLAEARMLHHKLTHLEVKKNATN